MELEQLSRQLGKVNFTPPLKISSHCKLKSGDQLGDYTVGRVLGQGRFATVWSIIKGDSTYAAKVYRCGDRNGEYYRNEVKILNKIFHFAFLSQNIPPNLIGYMGTFVHIEVGHDYSPNIHPCVMFRLAGDHVGRLLRHFRDEYDEGLPIVTVKKFMREILTGLAYLHKCGVIHTDIKPSNLLMNKKVDEITNLDDITVCIGDLGSSTPADDIFTQHVGTDGYIAPELILEKKYTQAIDIWAAFVVCYELITGELLFDVYGECDVDYGEDIKDDIRRQDSREDDAPADEAMDVMGGGSDTDSSGDGSLSERKVNYNHLLLLEKVLGPAPKEFWSEGRKYYNARGRLLYNPDIEHLSISKLLQKNYDMNEWDCQEIENFLLCGLKYMPEDRISCEDALKHPWLQM